MMAWALQMQIKGINYITSSKHVHSKELQPISVTNRYITQHLHHVCDTEGWGGERGRMGRRERKDGEEIEEGWGGERGRMGRRERKDGEEIEEGWRGESGRMGRRERKDGEEREEGWRGESGRMGRSM